VQCVKLASKTDDLQDKALLIAMSERWRDLAEQVESMAILEDARPRSEFYLN